MLKFLQYIASEVEFFRDPKARRESNENCIEIILPRMIELSHFVYPFSFVVETLEPLIYCSWRFFQRSLHFPRNSLLKKHVYKFMICMLRFLTWLISCRFFRFFEYIFCNSYILSNALRNLVPFAQFKVREKHSWMSATFIKLTGFRLQIY